MLSWEPGADGCWFREICYLFGSVFLLLCLVSLLLLESNLQYNLEILIFISSGRVKMEKNFIFSYNFF